MEKQCEFQGTLSTQFCTNFSRQYKRNFRLSFLALWQTKARFNEVKRLRNELGKGQSANDTFLPRNWNFTQWIPFQVSLVIIALCILISIFQHLQNTSWIKEIPLSLTSKRMYHDLPAYKFLECGPIIVYILIKYSPIFV